MISRNELLHRVNGVQGINRDSTARTQNNRGNIYVNGNLKFQRIPPQNWEQLIQQMLTEVTTVTITITTTTTTTTTADAADAAAMNTTITAVTNFTANTASTAINILTIAINVTSPAATAMTWLI